MDSGKFSWLTRRGTRVGSTISKTLRRQILAIEAMSEKYSLPTFHEIKLGDSFQFDGRLWFVVAKNERKKALLVSYWEGSARTTKWVAFAGLLTSLTP